MKQTIFPKMPTGEAAANLLVHIKQMRAYYDQVEAHCRELLAKDPNAIPGWTLAPGAVRRSIEDPVAACNHLGDALPLDEFIDCCTPSVPKLEKAWAAAEGVPASQSKEAFARFMGKLIMEKQNSPSLKQTTIGQMMAAAQEAA